MSTEFERSGPRLCDLLAGPARSRSRSVLQPLRSRLLFFVVIDKLTPYHLWTEIVDKKNVALAIVLGAMCIAVGLIVAAAVHG